MKTRILLCVNTNKEHYIRAIEGAGGEPVASYIPTLDMDYDGLILCGGTDLDPVFYGQELNGSVEIDRPRDDAEWAYLTEFLKTGKPIMGICRGFQLLNAYFGGDLIQHLDTVSVHRGSLEHYPVHPVRSAENSFLRRMYGEEFFVNSCHHQGIKTLAKGLIPTAFAGDLVEAFEHETLPVFAVQWHPEKMCYGMRRDDACDGAPLFQYFLKLCEGKKRGL